MIQSFIATVQIGNSTPSKMVAKGSGDTPGVRRHNAMQSLAAELHRLGHRDIRITSRGSCGRRSATA